jgi:hypothetical protein
VAALADVLAILVALGCLPGGGLGLEGVSKGRPLGR